MCCRVLYQSEVICHFVATCPFFYFDSPQRARASSFTRFLDHTQRRTTVVISSSLRPLPAQHATLTTDIHAPGGFRTHNLSRRAVADLRLHWSQKRHTQRPRQTPDKEVEIKNISLRQRLKPIRLGCYLPQQSGANKVSLFRADSLARYLLQCA